MVTWFANTGIGRDYLGVPKDIGLMLPNGYIRTDDGKHCQATFIPKAIYAPKLYPALAKIDMVYEYLKHFGDLKKWYASFDEFKKLLVWNLDLGAKHIPALAGMMFVSPLTVYPNPHPETTSVDGDVAYQDVGVDHTWATIHDATEGLNDIQTASGEANFANLNSGTGSGKWWMFVRSFFLFDTSPIGATSAVSSATCSFYATLRLDTYTDELCLVSSNPASNTDLAFADYDQLGTTLYAPNITFADISTGAYNPFTLNATGRSAINVIGITKFGLRSNYDRTDTPPTWQIEITGRIVGYYSDQGSNQPKLIVNYIPATTNYLRNYRADFGRVSFEV